MAGHKRKGSKANYIGGCNTNESYSISRQERVTKLLSGVSKKGAFKRPERPEAYFKNGNRLAPNWDVKQKCQRYCIKCLKEPLDYAAYSPIENRVCSKCEGK